MSKLKYLLTGFILAALTAGCASNVPKLIQQKPPTNIEIIEARLNPERVIGSRVRWGGNIVAVENRKNHTLVEILGRPLSTSGEPDDSAKSKGRFLVRLSGFLDPEEYSRGRLLSVTGVLSANLKKSIGTYVYDYPVVTAEAHYLWPEVEAYPYPYYRDPFYRDPFFNPWYPYGYRHPYYWW